MSRVVSFMVFMLVVGCGSELRRAQVQKHPASAETLPVDFPPPPAMVEELPKDPGEPCVWVDGRWEYLNRRWEWTGGAWVKPKSECFYSPPVMFWASPELGGDLHHRPGRWHTSSGEPCDEPIACRLPD